jgi:hypothetical protein
MATIQPQVLISGRYLVGEAIASGQGSDVFRSDDQVLKRAVALKLVNPIHTAAYRAALGATTHIGHPAFVGVFDSLEHEGRLAIIQEWINGQRFADLAGADLSPSAIARVGRQIALALAHAHRHGVVHGDLTPSAIFRDQWGAIRINNVMLPADAAYFAVAGHLLAAGAETWQITMPTIGDDLRATGVLLWLLLAHRADPPSEATGLQDDWELVGRPVPDALRDVIERLADPEHPRAINTAEMLVSELSACIRAIDPRAPARSLPPWEESQPGAARISRPLASTPRPAMSSPASTQPSIDHDTIHEIAARTVANARPMVVGGTPTRGGDDDATWIGTHNPQSLARLANHDPNATAPATSAPQLTSRDYVLWIALGIGLFIFWLVIGYLLRGLL